MLDKRSRFPGSLSALCYRFPLRIAAIASVAFVAILFFLLPGDHPSQMCSQQQPSYILPAPMTCAEETKRNGPIPNIVHFVYILKEPDADFAFEFSHFLSIYATMYYWNPDEIYLHTNVDKKGRAVSRAAAGKVGKWNKLIFTIFNLKINKVEVPTRAGNGREITAMEHRSDFVRVQAIHDLGGTYIDWDVHPLRDTKFLRQSGFRAVAGRQHGDDINSGVFMSEPRGKMMALWLDNMHRVYNGSWTTHSNDVVTQFGQRLVREPGEMLIMERDAFAPGGWESHETDWLFGTHNDVGSNLENYKRGDELPAFVEEFSDRWDSPDLFPSWDYDFSISYLIHAFSPDRSNHRVYGFDHITPRYILERKSIFARAVYPVARQMLIDGLIDVDDSHTGIVG